MSTAAWRQGQNEERRGELSYRGHMVEELSIGLGFS